MELMNRSRSYFYIFIYCILFPVLLQGQSMYAVNYTFKDGLPSDEVYWLKEGSNGLLWIGSDKGLVSYDGVSFKKYEAPKARNKSITGIFEDSKGTIWCHNFAGQIYYIKQGKLCLFDVWENLKGNIYVYDFSLEDDILKITASHGNWIYDIVTGQLKNIGDCYYLLNSGKKLFFTAHLGFYSKIKGKKIPYACPDCFFFSDDRNMLSMQQIKSKTLECFYVSNYFAHDWENRKGKVTDEGMKIPFIFLVQKDTLQALYFPPKIAKYGRDFIINRINIVDENTLYLSTSDGLFIWNLINDKVSHFFKGKRLSSSFFDTEENLWLSSLNEGVFFVPRSDQRVHNERIENKTIYQVEADQYGNLLIGYDDGSIVYWNPTKDQILFEKTFLVKRRIQNIIYNKERDEYWISTGKKTWIFYPEKLKIKTRGGVGPAAKDLTFDDRGNVVIASWIVAHLMMIDSTNSKGIQLPKKWGEIKRERREGFFKTRISEKGTRNYSILFQKKPEYTIYLGTSSKLLYFNKKTPTEIKDEKGVAIIATCLLSVNDSTFWAGTVSDGLYCIQNKEVIKHVKFEKGKAYNEIRKLRINDNTLWAISSSGIVQYDLTTNAFSIWDKGNGLPSVNVFDIDFVGDKIYLGMKEGLVSMPINLEMNTKKTVMKLTQLMVNDSIYPLQKTYNLSPHENTLKVEFRGISFKSQNNFRYEYRLKGVEENWNKVSNTNNIVNYPDLNPGNYAFQAVYIKADGSRSDPLSIRILINAPFYTKWWFIVLVGSLIVLVISWVYKNQINKIKTQNEEKLERSRLERDIRISELKALKAQLNPHFMFNALNSIQDYIIQNERELASDYLGMFSDLMRLYLNHSQAGQISLKEEIDSLKLYLELEAIRMDVDFNYSIQIKDNINAYEMLIPTMLVQPYVENAIKHGLFHKEGAKEIEISFSQPSPTFVLAIIRDNGIGRAAAEKHARRRLNHHKSFATAANNSRLELLNYGRNISIKAEILDLEAAGKAKGTEVRISIPIEKDVD